MKKFLPGDISGSKLCGVTSLVQEAPAHDGPIHFSGLGWDRYRGSHPVLDESVVSQVVELSIGQHQPDPCVPGSFLHLLEQVPIFVTVTSSCTPRLHQLSIQFDHDQSFQSKTPTQELRPTAGYELPPNIREKILYITPLGSNWVCIDPADDQRKGDFDY